MIICITFSCKKEKRRQPLLIPPDLFSRFSMRYLQPIYIAQEIQLLQYSTSIRAIARLSLTTSTRVCQWDTCTCFWLNCQTQNRWGRYEGPRSSTGSLEMPSFHKTISCLSHMLSVNSLSSVIQVPVKDGKSYRRVHFWQFGQKYGHVCSLLEITLQGSGIALHVPSLTKESILVVLLSWCPSTILPSFPSVTACLLISPPHSWGSARRLSKASCDGRYWRAILWDLKHLCNLNGLPVPFHAASNYTVTLSKTKIEKKTVKRDKD